MAAVWGAGGPGQPATTLVMLDAQARFSRVFRVCWERCKPCTVQPHPALFIPPFLTTCALGPDRQARHVQIVSWPFAAGWPGGPAAVQPAERPHPEAAQGRCRGGRRRRLLLHLHRPPQGGRRNHGFVAANTTVLHPRMCVEAGDAGFCSTVMEPSCAREAFLRQPLALEQKTVRPGCRLPML